MLRRKARGSAKSIGALPPETADMVRWQHEAWDGTGYPDTLRWTGIPRPAQFLGMADCFVRVARSRSGA